jgi:hypothetical protein
MDFVFCRGSGGSAVKTACKVWFVPNARCSVINRMVLLAA